VPKETYSYSKRDLFIFQKRPIHMPKETYSYAKRDLYSYAKRDLFILFMRKKRLTDMSIPEICVNAKTDLSYGNRGLLYGKIGLLYGKTGLLNGKTGLSYGKRGL
jgi:hypothetical protein